MIFIQKGTTVKKGRLCSSYRGIVHWLGCILWAQKRICEKVEKTMDFRPRVTCPGKSDPSILWDEIILDQVFVKFWWRVLEETEKTSTKNTVLLLLLLLFAPTSNPAIARSSHCCRHFVGSVLITFEQRCNTIVGRTVRASPLSMLGTFFVVVCTGTAVSIRCMP